MMRFGVPASGPMDRLAHAAAQVAVGRPEGATAIEISMGGLEMACVSGEVTCCVAGGEFHVVHSGSVASSWCVRTLRTGDVLSVRPGRWGSWAYLAFSGELARVVAAIVDTARWWRVLAWSVSICLRRVSSTVAWRRLRRVC